MLFNIHSASSSRELIFSSSHKKDCFRVELKSFDVSASTEVWAATNMSGLNALFQELAGFRKPWQGARSWGSLEGEFEISATCTTLGHVIFWVKLSGYPGETETWEVQGGLETGLGQLDEIAQNANAFFQATST